MELFDTPLAPQQLRELPTLSLAYIGDGVFELLARQHVLGQGTARASSLHRRVVAFTRAEAQAVAAQALWPTLGDAERAVFLRGRNAKPHSIPRHATAREYALATGLEALFGWLWLAGERERLLELWAAIIAPKDHEKSL